VDLQRQLRARRAFRHFVDRRRPTHRLPPPDRGPG
jgi:hypothetical protein